MKRSGSFPACPYASPSSRHFESGLYGGVWPRQKRHRRHLAEAVMGSLGVVNLEPRLGDHAHLLEGVKEVGVEDLFAETPIEPLDEGVLIGFPRLDVADGNTLRRAPLDKGLGRELRPVVDAHAGGPAVEPNELI